MQWSGPLVEWVPLGTSGSDLHPGRHEGSAQRTVIGGGQGSTPTLAFLGKNKLVFGSQRAEGNQGSEWSMGVQISCGPAGFLYMAHICSTAKRTSGQKWNLRVAWAGSRGRKCPSSLVYSSL